MDFVSAGKNTLIISHYKIVCAQGNTHLLILCSLQFSTEQWFLTLGSRTIFGGVASRLDILCTQLLRLLYSSFRWGRLAAGCYNGSR